MQKNRRNGFTLIEMVISVAILGLLMGSLASIGTTSRKAFLTSSDQLELETRAHRAMARVLENLRGVSVDTMEDDDPSLPDGASNFRFQVAQGRDADGNIQLAPFRRLAWELDPAELDNGVDDDNDGKIDEGRIVLTRNDGLPGAQRVVLCNDVAELAENETANAADDNGNGAVDEAGFLVQRQGGLLTLSITVEGIDPQTGARLQRTLQTAVRMRNGL